MEKDKPLLIIKAESGFPASKLSYLKDSLAPVAKSLGVEIMLLPNSLDAETVRIAKVLDPILSAMARQTEAIQCLADGTAALIQAMAESEEEGEEREPQSYLDGSPCR